MEPLPVRLRALVQCLKERRYDRQRDGTGTVSRIKRIAQDPERHIPLLWEPSAHSLCMAASQSVSVPLLTAIAGSTALTRPHTAMDSYQIAL